MATKKTNIYSLKQIYKNVLDKGYNLNRSEVVKVTQLDYTFDRQIMLEREDAREEGRAMGLAEGLAEGRAEGRQEGLAEGRAEGRQEGLAEGRAEGRQEGSTKKAKKIAQKMLKANKPLEEIMEFTELSMDELVELAEEITGIGRKEK